MENEINENIDQKICQTKSSDKLALLNSNNRNNNNSSKYLELTELHADGIEGGLGRKIVVTDDNNLSQNFCPATDIESVSSEKHPPDSDDLLETMHAEDMKGVICAVDKDMSPTAVQNKQKHRRWKPRKPRKHRKWKPYFKLSWREKRELEDREGKRATRIRAERFAHGQPVAPYNTTQFLMEDHNINEPDLKPVAGTHQRRYQHHPEHSNREILLNGTEGDDSSDHTLFCPMQEDEMEERFLQKEFSEIYDSIHTERLNSMPKIELIQEYLQLEDKEERLVRKLRNHLSPCHYIADDSLTESKENAEKIRIFKDEIQKLIEQNNKLRDENKRLMDIE